MSTNHFKGSLLATTMIASAAFAVPALAQTTATPQTTGPAPVITAAPTNTQGDAATVSTSAQTPAAGTQSTEAAGPAEPNSQAEIVVTGTLIRNPNLVASAPVTVVGQEEIRLKQSNVAEEVLRSIPGVVPSIGSNVNNGNGGASFVNLRGIGANRNLVLLDGTRIVPGTLSGLVDLNNIPLALVDRVDVLTGGASSTYGADAVGGVVNFITRSDFAGIEASASEQISERGDGNILRTDLTIGANFEDGRGNAVFSIGYQEADPVYFGGNDRPKSQVTLESFDEFFVAGQGSSTTVPAAFDIGGGRRRQQISPDGTGIGNFYQSFNFNPYNVFQVPFKRYNMYGAGHYDVADGITVYGRGLYSNNTVDTIIAPSGIFASSVVVPVSNPYLSAAQRAYFCANADFNPALGGQQTLTPAQCTAAATALTPADPNYQQFTVGLRRRTPEVGPRISDYNTQIFDFKVGVRGDITQHIGFDLFASRGESTNTQSIQNYVLLSRVRQALLSTNTTSCLTPTNGCIPINVFGTNGTITPAVADYISDDSQTVTKSRLSQVRGVINGDVPFTSPFAENPLSFAVGGEYRKYKASQISDILAKSAGELGGAGGAAPDVRGGFDVYEGFAELIAPLVSDKPFFHSLTVEGGIRRSNYKIAAAGNPSFKTTTWKVAGSWEPVRDLKFRGNYQHAVRAPNISELFSPQNTGLTNLGTDPCAQNVAFFATAASANLRAVCVAQGAPAAQIGFIQNPTAGQANSTGGGNPLLKPEVANTWTVGAVLQPRFIPGFTASIDYYHIKVNGAVSSPTPDDIIKACFGSDPKNPPASAASSLACTTIRRNPISGGLDGPPDTTPGLPSVLSNLGKIMTDGVDVTMNYRRTLGQLLGQNAKINLAFGGNYTRRSKFQATPSALDRECTSFYSANCGSIQPKYSFNQRTTLSLGRVDLSLLWRYISKTQYEPKQFIADGCAGLTDAADAVSAGGDACQVDTRFRKIKAYNYFDLSTRFNVTDHFDMTVTVTNLLDKKPPTVGGTVGSTGFNGGNTYPSTYDAVGRRYAVGARLKF